MTEVTKRVIIEIPCEPEVIELFKKLAGTGPIPWLMVFNGAIDHIIQNNPKAKQNPRGLSQLDGYKRGRVNSLTGNLQKFGLDRVLKVGTLEEVLQDARKRNWLSLWIVLVRYYLAGRAKKSQSPHKNASAQRFIHATPSVKIGRRSGKLLWHCFCYSQLHHRSERCESNRSPHGHAVDISIPAAVTVFPGEIYRGQEAGASGVITSSFISTR
jgi:hypothetical protein